MIELTGGGDDGTTGLLGGGRAPKDDARIEAYGTVDETSSALGLAKALAQGARTREVCEELQRGLYRLGAELATEPGRTGAFALTTAEDVERLEQLAAGLEAEAPMPSEFILPGSTPASGALDLARAVARRAERRALAFRRGFPELNPELLRWLNRLSLLLFVLARYEEAKAGRGAPPAREGRPPRA